MPRKSTYQVPEIETKNFTLDEIDRGIKKIKRRIDEVENLDSNKILHDDASVETAKNNIRDSVREVFGQNSQEARDFAYPEIYDSNDYISDWNEVIDDQFFFAKGISKMVKLLNGLIAKLEEKRDDLGENPKIQATIIFEGMNLHPRIAGVCTDLYKNGHYSQAVFEASKALVNFVKERSGIHNLDGTQLMSNVFKKDEPILAFNEGSDQTDKDEQQGMMYLFMGAVLGVRNPRGHSLLTDSPEEALEFIGLLSFLANRAEKANRKIYE